MKEKKISYRKLEEYLIHMKKVCDYPFMKSQGAYSNGAYTAYCVILNALYDDRFDDDSES